MASPGSEALPGSTRRSGPPPRRTPPGHAQNPAHLPRPSGVRVRARRRRATPGGTRDTSCRTRRTAEVRTWGDGAAEGGKVQHRQQGKRAARLGAAAPGRAALPLGSLGVHGVQGESWRRLRPLPPRVRAERPRPPESRAARGRSAGDVVGPPAAGLRAALGAHVWGRCPGTQPRSAVPGARRGWQGAGCRGLGASQAQAPPLRRAELGRLEPPPVPPGCRRNGREPVGQS